MEIVAAIFHGRISRVVAGKRHAIFVGLGVHDLAERALILDVGHDDFAVGRDGTGQQDGNIAVGKLGLHRIAVQPHAESALIGTVVWREHVAEAIADGVDSYKLLAERKQRPKVIADYRRSPAK